MIVNALINLIAALAMCSWLYRLQRHHASFSVQVFTGLGLGVVLGAVMHFVYGTASPLDHDNQRLLRYCWYRTRQAVANDRRAADHGVDCERDCQT